MYRHMKKVVIAGAVSLFLAGCMSDSSSQAPTHRWASTGGAADEIQYRNDHARCQAKANIGDDQRKLNPASPAFAAYSQCMNDHGYELTAYRD